MNDSQQLLYTDPQLGLNPELVSDPELVYASNQEDRNVVLTQRMDLLRQIAIKLENQNVPRGFWAICQFADIERLKVHAQYEPWQIAGWMDVCDHAINQCIPASF